MVKSPLDVYLGINPFLEVSETQTARPLIEPQVAPTSARHGDFRIAVVGRVSIAYVDKPLRGLDFLWSRAVRVSFDLFALSGFRFPFVEPVRIFNVTVIIRTVRTPRAAGANLVAVRNIVQGRIGAEILFQPALMG